MTPKNRDSANRDRMAASKGQYLENKSQRLTNQGLGFANGEKGGEDKRYSNQRKGSAEDLGGEKDGSMGGGKGLVRRGGGGKNGRGILAQSLFFNNRASGEVRQELTNR